MRNEIKTALNEVKIARMESREIPRLSIGLPVYNGERYLCEALDSLLQQDYQDFELIISDNASTDRTPEICKDYASKERRIRYLRNKSNVGCHPNYDRVFKLARGAFFKWAAHDDVCRPGMIRRCMEVMEASSRPVVLVYPRSEIIDETGRMIGVAPDRMDAQSRWACARLGKMLFSVQYGCPLWGIIRASALEKTRLFSAPIMADFVLLAELMMLGHVLEVPEPLLALRIHSGNSNAICGTAEQLIEWGDTKRRGKRVCVPAALVIFLEYMKAVWCLRLGVFDKLLCAGTIPSVQVWRRLLRRTAWVRHRMRARQETGPHIALASADAAPTQGAASYYSCSHKPAPCRHRD